MSVLFEETSIKGMTLKNRFIRSATWEGMADEKGRMTPRLYDLYARLADGGTALLILSHAFVRRDGQVGAGQLSFSSDDQIPEYRKLTELVHSRGAKICTQLAHAGFLAREKLTGAPLIGASAHVQGYDHTARELNREGIAELASAFAKAAARAVEAGFDAVQIHAAHTYLLSQFLSPYFNHRTDEYGGSVENRARAAFQVYGEIRSAVGADYPVLIKINADDFLEGGFSSEDSAAVCRMLSERGIDAIELSGGNLVVPKYRPARPGKITPETEVFYRSQAERVKSSITCPLMLVGGIRSFETAERLTRKKLADYISLSRPLIREPDLVKRWESGDRRPAGCLSDNACYKPIYAGEGIRCPHLDQAE